VRGKEGRAPAVNGAVIGVPGSGVRDGRAILLVASYGTACLGGGLRCVRVTGAASAVVRPHAVIVGGARRQPGVGIRRHDAHRGDLSKRHASPALTPLDVQSTP